MESFLTLCSSAPLLLQFLSHHIVIRYNPDLLAITGSFWGRSPANLWFQLYCFAILFLVQGNVYLVFWDQLGLFVFSFLSSVTITCLEQKGSTKASCLEVEICIFNKLSMWFICTFKFFNICTLFFSVEKTEAIWPELIQPQIPYITTSSFSIFPAFDEMSSHLSRAKYSSSALNSVTFQDPF